MKCFLLLLAATAVLHAKGYEAGVEKIDITPDRPIWLSGYGNRSHPSTGVRTRLWAKALAIKDDRNQGVIIITTDLIGLPRAITDVVSARLSIDHSIPRTGIPFDLVSPDGERSRLGRPLTSFSFRATAPLFVDQPIRLTGGDQPGAFRAIRCDGVVAMTTLAGL